jgi:hypothetical protein
MAREQTAKERTKSYIAALEREAEGYEAKVRGAKETGDKTAQALYESRLKQVQTEIARAKKEGQTPVTTDEVEADNRPEEEQEEE